ncbi:MAG: polysaccharide export protein [Phycisphaerae bacterium]|nr:polysaccharide export protein [Phycisphaerae bacterium]
MSGVRRHVVVSVAFAVGVASLGCEDNHEDLKVFLKAHEHKVSASSYQVQPPDVMLISAPGCPEVDGDAQAIRTDGMISLRLLGEVRVVGLTPSEIAAKLEKLLKRYYVDPKVHVRVGGYNSKVYYVMGEVGMAGPKPYTGRDTLMDALAKAQPTFLAWKSQIKVVRPSANKNENHTIIIDVDKMVKEGDMRQNVLLQQGDVVYVPPTPLAWVGLRIRELLYPVGPVIQAYSAPADFLDSYDTYKYRSARDDMYKNYDKDNDEKAWQRLLLR